MAKRKRIKGQTQINSIFCILNVFDDIKKKMESMLKLSHILCFSNQVCQWKITASQGSIVQIKVVDFFLEDSESCMSDNVVIYDGKYISRSCMSDNVIIYDGKYISRSCMSGNVIIYDGKYKSRSCMSDNVIIYDGKYKNWSCMSDNVIIYDGKCISHDSAKSNPETRYAHGRLYMY